MSTPSLEQLADDPSACVTAEYAAQLASAVARGDALGESRLAQLAIRLAAWTPHPAAADERAARLAALRAVLPRVRHPAYLLASALPFPDALELVLGEPAVTDADAGAALVTAYHWTSLGPHPAAGALLIARAPREARDHALASAALALARMRAIPDAFQLDALERIARTDARPDRVPGELPSALHSLAGAWGASPTRSVTAKHAKRVARVIARVDAVFDACVARAEQLDVRDAAGFTPLHRACAAVHPARVRRLRAAGADPRATTNDGLDAAALASRYAPAVAAELLAALEPHGPA